MKNYSDLLELAIKIALEYHSGQVDKAGNPYILHPLAVMNNPILKTYEEKIVAVCHDLFEDTEMTPEKMLKLGFPERIVNCILALSKPDNMEYTDYIQFIKSYPDSIVRTVKKADLIHNSDTSRLKNITEKDIKRTEKYKKAIKELDELDSNSLASKISKIKNFIDNNKKFDDIIYQIEIKDNHINNDLIIYIYYDYSSQAEDIYLNEHDEIPWRYNRIYRMTLMQEYFKRFFDTTIYIHWQPQCVKHNKTVYKLYKEF